MSGQFCTFELDGALFGVPVDHVQELLRQQRMTPVPLAPRFVSGLINLRGQIVLALELRRRLSLPDRSSAAPNMNVVVRTRQGAVALVVDTIGDVITPEQSTFETVPDTLQSAARELIQGTYKLDGRLLLVLDLERLFSVPILGTAAGTARSAGTQPE